MNFYKNHSYFISKTHNSKKTKILSKLIYTIFVLFKIEFATNFSSKKYLQAVLVISNLEKHISTNRHKLKPNNKEVIHL